MSAEYLSNKFSVNHIVKMLYEIISAKQYRQTSILAENGTSNDNEIQRRKIKSAKPENTFNQ